MHSITQILKCSLVSVVVFFCTDLYAIVTIGNGVYDVNIQSSSNDPVQFGSWNAITGLNHTVGAGRDLTFRDQITRTNFSSLRVFDSIPRDYTFGGVGSGAATNLDTSLVSEGASPFHSNGYQTVWQISNEGLMITQDLLVVGTTTNDSAVYHTVSVENIGAGSQSIGWRNLYDWDVDDPVVDDGPSNSVERCIAGIPEILVPTTSDQYFTHSPIPGDGSFVRVAAAPQPLGGATYEVLLGLGHDPGLLPSLPTSTLTRYDFASWPQARNSDFDFPAPATFIDSAGLSWFGHDATNAFEIAPGDSVRFTQALTAVAPGECFIGCVEEAPLSDLLEGGIICSGDKTFTDFQYHGGGDMPEAEDIFVTAITDADGNFGIRYQGAFVDGVGGGASDALIDFKVTAPEGKLIKDVHLAANPLVIGGDDGFLSITETFLPDNDEVVLSVYDIPGGERKLTDWADLVDENGELVPVQELHVQKDILVWSQEQGSAATMSFIDQTFSQCDDDGTGACVEEVVPISCDFDGDGDVDAADLAILLASYGTAVTPGTNGDVDSDGDVDGNDFLSWQRHLTNFSAPIASTTTVPEPTALLLLSSGALMLHSRRRIA